MKTVVTETMRTEPAPARPSLASLLMRGLSTIAGGFIREMRIRRDMRHLESLSDNILSDIGISRGHITHALRQGRVHPDATRATPARKDGKGGETRPAMGKIIKLVRPSPVSPTRQGPHRKAG
jgi:uncharacterized protein YjiS (DUF1127 family)